MIEEIAARIGALGADERALEDLVGDGPMSREMARWALRSSVARYVPDVMAAVVARGDLAGRDVAVVLAHSVATAPLRAMVMPVLRGARRVRVRPPRGQERFAARVGALLADFEGVAIGCEGSGESGAAFVARAVRDGADTVIAFGGDETLARIAGELPGETRFEGHGHGLGVSVVLAGATLDGVACDVAHHDQFGCLSPRFVLAVGDDAAPVAEAIADGLADLGRTLPRAQLDASLAASVNQWQGATAARARAFFRGASYAVAAMTEATVLDSPGARNVAVIPVRSGEHAAQLLAPLARHLTCIGVAGDLAQWNSPAGAAARVVSAGTMQDPPIETDANRSGYEDPRPPITRR